jgi:transglutaminase-like putative cysteine protease
MDPATPPTDMEACLGPTRFLDFETGPIRDLALETTAGAATDEDRVVRLFYAVRDGIRYDYRAVDLDPEALVASKVLAAGRSFCVGKAVVLAASCRAVGVPCRLGFADVRNHLAPEGLTRVMGTDTFVFHGYVAMWLGRWVKATPAFDKGLCERFGVKPIEFDGEHHALFHEFDAKGELHMEYVRMRGEYDDLPHEEMARAFREAYPSVFGS